MFPPTPTGTNRGTSCKSRFRIISLVPLLPRIFTWKTAADNNPLVIQGVYSADLIEPASITDRPCIGTAP